MRVRLGHRRRARLRRCPLRAGRGRLPPAPRAGRHHAARRGACSVVPSATGPGLTGPAPNGTEYTLYASGGPLLFRVTGVAPMGYTPALDVEAIAHRAVRTTVHRLLRRSRTTSRRRSSRPRPQLMPRGSPSPKPRCSPPPFRCPRATPMPLPTAIFYCPPTDGAAANRRPAPNTISVPSVFDGAPNASAWRDRDALYAPRRRPRRASSDPPTPGKRDDGALTGLTPLLSRRDERGNPDRFTLSRRRAGERLG